MTCKHISLNNTRLLQIWLKSPDNGFKNRFCFCMFTTQYDRNWVVHVHMVVVNLIVDKGQTRMCASVLYVLLLWAKLELAEHVNTLTAFKPQCRATVLSMHDSVTSDKYVMDLKWQNTKSNRPVASAKVNISLFLLLAALLICMPDTQGCEFLRHRGENLRFALYPLL